MTVAALHDIHGKLPALRAVLAEARREGIERFVIGGDVADGPCPRETLKLLIGLPADHTSFVAGDSDREVVEEMDRAEAVTAGGDPAGQLTRFTARALSIAPRDFLAGLAPSTTRTARAG